MDFKEYKIKASQDIQYPSIGDYEFLFPFIGLAGEAGEVMEKAIIYFSIPDKDKEGKEHLRLQTLEEIGDMLWYTMRCCEELNFDFENLLISNDAVEFHITNPVYLLCVKSTKVLNAIKRIFSNNNSELTHSMKYYLLDELNEILKLILQSVVYLDGNIFELMKQNCEKVNSKFDSKELH